MSGLSSPAARMMSTISVDTTAAADDLLNGQVAVRAAALGSAHAFHQGGLDRLEKTHLLPYGSGLFARRSQRDALDSASTASA